MRIALRTGGGRGVYELAGRQGKLNASALFGREMFYELTPGIIVPGRATASIHNGKPRINLDDNERSTTTHLYRLLAAVLLLPKPKREFKKTHGENLLVAGAYSMTAIKVDVSDISAEKVILRPTDLLLENADNHSSKIEFAERMSRITLLWEVATPGNTPLALSLQSHKQAILKADPDFKEIEGCAIHILKLLNVDGDPLPFAEQQLGIGAVQQRPIIPAQFTHQADFGIEDDTSPLEARLERVKQWREVSVRGAAGEKFRKDVRKNYDFRCLFTGQRLPKMEETESAGVDAAHILPWSTHNINAVQNGICLNKLCHWAFDAGVVKLFYDAKVSSYVVQIPEAVRNAATKASFDIGCIEGFSGPIPVDRLPKNTKLWPSPKYLDDLNKFVFG